jgi:hypothetical protein
LYLGAKNDPLYEYGVGMNKIFDYMLAKKPVINGIKSEGNPLELSGCALTVAPEQATDLAEGIKKLQQMSQTTRDEMGQKGYDYVIKHHDYTVLAEKFIDAFNTVK